MSHAVQIQLWGGPRDGDYLTRADLPPEVHVLNVGINRPNEWLTYRIDRRAEGGKFWWYRYTGRRTPPTPPE